MSNTKKLSLAGVLIALIIVLSSYCQIPLGTSIRLDLGYAIVVFAAMFMGPIYGGVIAFLARIIADLIFSGSISIWWAIGSAFFGLAIGIMTKLTNKLIKKRIKIIVIYISIIIISFISFAGIVPIIALCFGLNYYFMLSIGVLASIADAIVALVLGFPAYYIIHEKMNINNKNPH